MPIDQYHPVEDQKFPPAVYRPGFPDKNKRKSFLALVKYWSSRKETDLEESFLLVEG
jgi:hypothetical protein